MKVYADGEFGSQQHKREQQNTETKFLLALENTSDIITVFDRDWRITYLSPAMHRALGVDPRTRIGASIYDSVLAHPDDLEKLRHFLKRLVKANPGQELKEYIRLRHVDGSYRDMEIIGVNMLHDPVLNAVVLTSRDVTETRAATMALAESEAKYALTINDAPIGIAHCEPEDGRFVLVNQYLCDILGYDQGELLKKRFKDITGSEDLSLNLQAVQALQDDKISNYQHDQLCYRKDSSSLWVSVRMTVQRDTSGNIAFFLITIEDIGERKRAEEAMKKQHELEAKAAVLADQREQLIAINKAKDEFVSLASHQLRTPATAVKQYIGMLLQGYLGPVTPEQRDGLAKAYESNERQLRIIDQLLYVARLDAGNVQLEQSETDLSKLLADIVEEQRISFKERSQTVVLDRPASPVIALVDERLLRMAIENLIDNAGKYSPTGRAITVSLHKSGQRVSIAVRDHGVGISKSQQVHLFQKFSRIDNPRSIAAGGTGLGLYWAKKIVDLHHGEIKVDSKPRQGSTFTVTLLQAVVSENERLLQPAK